MPARFYEFTTSRASPFVASPDPPLSWEQSAALIQGDWVPARPLVFTRRGGRRTPDDLAYGGRVHVPLVSEKLVCALRDGPLTGWATYPVVLRDQDGTSFSDYAGLAITGRCGPVDVTLGEESLALTGYFAAACTSMRPHGMGRTSFYLHLEAACS